MVKILKFTPAPKWSEYLGFMDIERPAGMYYITTGRKRVGVTRDVGIIRFPDGQIKFTTFYGSKVANRCFMKKLFEQLEEIPEYRWARDERDL